MKLTRDYDKEPIIIKNQYLFKKELMVCVFFAPITIFSLYYLYFIKLSKEKMIGDKVDIMFTNIGISMAVIGLIMLMYFFVKAVKHSKTMLYIKIYDNRIEYDYFTEKYNIKNYILLKKDIKSISYGYYPYSILDDKDEIWITEEKEDKFGTFILSPISFLLSFIYLILYIFVNLKIEKYVYLRFKGGIISIPKDDFPDNENLKFEWKSLFNRQILGGNYYGK